MRVLVTGGAGYIGSVIVEELARAGHMPFVYDSFAAGNRDAIEPGVPCIAGDVRDTAHLERMLRERRINAVIHMAGVIQVAESVAHPERYFDTNVSGSLSVVHAMLAAGVKRLVFSSTGSLYQDTGQVPFSEDDPVAPTNPYAQSKLIVEQALSWIAPAHGLICTALRYFNAAGATARHGETHTPETHLIPNVLRAVAEGRAVPVYGTDYPTPDGTAVRDYIHVLDLAQAHLLALGREAPGLRIYNAGAGTGYSVRQVIETARTVTGAALPIEEHPRRPGDAAATVASSRRIRDELGWEPRHHALEDIITSAWRWMRACDLTPSSSPAGEG